MHKQLHDAYKGPPDKRWAGAFCVCYHTVLIIASGVHKHAWNATQSRTLALSLTLRRGYQCHSCCQPLHVICTICASQQHAPLQQGLLTYPGSKQHVVIHLVRRSRPACTRLACIRGYDIKPFYYSPTLAHCSRPHPQTSHSPCSAGVLPGSTTGAAPRHTSPWYTTNSCPGATPRAGCCSEAST